MEITRYIFGELGDLKQQTKSLNKVKSYVKMSLMINA